jgi:flagellar operon protein
MSERVTIGQLFPNPTAPSVPKRTIPAQPTTTAQGQSFRDIFQEKMVRLSHHAEVRLQQRGLELKPEQLAKIQTAVDKAASKGSKDALLLMNDMALIVNVKNRTIVTAMDGASMKDNVFTQIDSAIFIS